MADEKSTENTSIPSTSARQNETIKYIGERSAIVFNAAAGEPLPPVELPDEFFELDKDDVQVIYKELRQNKDDLENMPFLTKAKREMEESATKLVQLKRYSQTVIRIQFPDRLVLQAVFNHSDTVQTVIDFVRTYLDPSDVQFYLYTAPPKSILKPQETLIDSKLTPRALVYFSADPPLDRTTFLKHSVTTCLTNPRLASEAALQYRSKVTSQKISVNTSVTVGTTKSLATDDNKDSIKRSRFNKSSVAEEIPTKLRKSLRSKSTASENVLPEKKMITRNMAKGTTAQGKDLNRGKHKTQIERNIEKNKSSPKPKNYKKKGKEQGIKKETNITMKNKKSVPLSSSRSSRATKYNSVKNTVAPATKTVSKK